MRQVKHGSAVFGQPPYPQPPSDQFAVWSAFGNPYYQDRLGSTRVLMSGSRDVQATYTYAGYGQVTQVGDDSCASTPLLFAGQLADIVGGSGLIYMRARWYDPATMQFMSRDPRPDPKVSGYSGERPRRRDRLAAPRCSWNPS